MPAHLYSVPQTLGHVFSWAQQHSMVWGLQKYISFSKYSRPDQPQLSLQIPLRSHFSSQLQALNNSFFTCDWLPQGSNLEAELGKHKIYTTWKKMKFCFLEGCWPLFMRQSHLISEFFWLSNRTSNKPVQAFEGLWRQTALQWAGRHGN